jgi:hypothetical protein
VSQRVNWGLATVGLTLVLVAAVSRQLSSTPITSATVVVAVGVLGPLALGDLRSSAGAVLVSPRLR